MFVKQIKRARNPIKGCLLERIQKREKTKKKGKSFERNHLSRSSRCGLNSVVA